MKKILVAIVLVGSASFVQAQTINNLTPGSAVSGTDLFPSYQGANPATAVSASQLKTFVGGIIAGAGASTTSGITSGNLIGSSGNLAVDSGVAYVNVALLNGSQNFTGVPSFNNVNGIKFAPSAGVISPFLLTSRNLTSLPVPIFYPTVNNTPIALDLSPHGTPTDIGYGTAWNDICSTDIIQFAANPLLCLHMSAGTNFNFGTAEYSGGTIPNLNIGVLNGDTATFTTAIVVFGANANIAFKQTLTDATNTDASLCRRTSDGLVMFGSGTAGICLGTSSARFKHDVAPLDTGLAQIMQLEAVSYKLNEDHGDPNKVLYGFTAEQGEKTLPVLAGNDEEGRVNTFDYMGVVPVLVKAVQEQQKEIERLKSRWCIGPFCWG